MKKALTVILAALMVIVPATGCKSNKATESYYSYYEDYPDDAGKGSTDSGSDGSNTESGNKGGSKNSGTGSGTDTKNSSTGSGTVNTKKYDFKGKTFTMALTWSEEMYHTTSFKATISAFEKKYNCKIKTVDLDFDKYNQQVSQRASSGESYDICYMHGSFFPDGAISGIYEDLTAAVKEIGSANISADKSDLFKWNGKLYGVCSYNSCYPVVMFYNKLLFENAGLEDPKALYNSGKWTWDKIFSMGKEVTDRNSDIYFLGSHFSEATLYGENYIYIDNGKVINNLMSSNIRRSLQLMQKIYVGNDAIGRNKRDDSYITEFSNGRVYAFIEESSKYNEAANAVKKSMAFNKSVDNIGVVPLPLPAENSKKLYPTGWYTAVCAGKGSDPRVAVLWQDFRAGYEVPVKGNNELSKDDKAMIEKLLKGPTIQSAHGQYANSNTRTAKLFEEIVYKAHDGADIAKTLNDYLPQFNACIEATVGKGSYTVK